MAAVPSRGRANRIEGAPAPEADLTRALYEQYANQIFRYCLHQLGSREEAEDATQSTFLNAFRGIKRGVVPELESAWLFAIAHNVCLSRRRSTWRRGKIESPADFDVVEELAPAPSRRADELIGLQDVLERLPEQQRRAILLREWQGLSYREIAEELELSQSAVETLIFRARRSLAHGLEQPVAPRRRRARAGALGNLLSSAQSFLLGGGAAVKVAATVAAIGATAVVATAPKQKPAPLQRQPAGAAWSNEAPARAGETSGAVTSPVLAGGVQRLAAPEQSAAEPVGAPVTHPAPLVAPEPAAPVVQPETPAAPAVVQEQPSAPAVDVPHVQPAERGSKGKGEEAGARTEAPGRTKSDEPSAKADAPGQPKQNGDTPSAKTEAPGQAKKRDDAPAAAATPETPTAAPASLAPAPPGGAEPQSNGNRPDKDKPKT